MPIKVNFDELYYRTGLRFSKDEIDNLLFYIQNTVEWLSTHNKNYNQGQIDRITTLNNIFSTMEVTP